MDTPKKTVLVEYVGLKPSRTDNLYGTNITWEGPGDVREVPADTWARMKVHRDIWREVVPGTSSLAPAPAPAPAEPLVADAATAPSTPPAPPAPTVALEAMTRDELFALATQRGLKPHTQLGKPKLLELLKKAA